MLAGAGSYRCEPFRRAAERLGIDAIAAADIPQPLTAAWSETFSIDYNDHEGAARHVAAAARQLEALAILALDDSATLVASLASAQAGLPHNAPEASLAARDKRVMRERLRAHGAPVPWFIASPMLTDPAEISRAIDYPCVVKPTRLSGSRGVIRADSPEAMEAAFLRVRRILETEGADPESTEILVEDYLPGREVAVEGMLTAGRLQVLAIFDKPDPLEGPYFEETVYVTPSRHSRAMQDLIHHRTAEAAASTGIHHGPVHAELRLDGGEAWIIEIAGRSIGGRCSSVLEFGAEQTLEELILRNAVGLPVERTELAAPATGVMMIPIPRSGVLKGVDGIDAAKAVEGVSDIEITAPVNAPIAALPEGAAYLGFIFARGETPDAVEHALRRAHAGLSIRIEPLLPMRRVG
jgi:biotin carboxylase